MQMQAVAVYNNWREVIVRGPILMVFTADGLTITIGDNFSLDAALRARLGSEMLRSVAELFEEQPEIKQQVVALADKTWK